MIIKSNKNNQGVLQPVSGNVMFFEGILKNDNHNELHYHKWNTVTNIISFLKLNLFLKLHPSRTILIILYEYTHTCYNNANLYPSIPLSICFRSSLVYPYKSFPNSASDFKQNLSESTSTIPLK